MSVGIKVEVVELWSDARLEHKPPPVHVVTVTSRHGEWREEIHGGKDAAKLFIRGVRAGAIEAGGSVDVELDWI